ncbi:MAG: hypothetical protein IJR13_02055 [Bacteroidales bacterium]|nr:hypothetical protein [Bacteroidales bacterium]
MTTIFYKPNISITEARVTPTIHKTLIEHRPSEERKVIFFDEMPWIDTPRSSFVEALEYFWNAWAAQRNVQCLSLCCAAEAIHLNESLDPPSDWITLLYRACKHHYSKYVTL